MLVLVLSVGLLSASRALKISPEIPTDLSLSLCSHQNKVRTHGHMQFFPEPVAYCASLRSTKHRRNQIHDEKQSTALSSLVSVAWRNVAANVQCQVHFKEFERSETPAVSPQLGGPAKRGRNCWYYTDFIRHFFLHGYQSEYRFSPDFGAYESCQFALSRHIFNLPESPWQIDTPPATLNDTDPDCPLLALPATYGDYVSCTLKTNAWYILDWRSSIQYETFFNGSYGTFWANHSTSFVFQPTDRLSLNGTEGDWLRRLLSVETRVSGCETTAVLVLVERHWLPLSTLSVFYRIKQNNAKSFQRLLTTETVDRWLQLDFLLHPAPGQHEVCVQLSSSTVSSLRQKLCKTILDQQDCPFSAAVSLLLPLAPFLFLWLA